MTLRGIASPLAGFVLVLGIAWPGPGRAQSSVTAAIGQNSDAATGVAATHGLSLGFTSYGGPGGLSVALGLPFEPRTGTRWGSGSGWGEWPALLAGLGVTTSVRGFGYHDAVLESGGAAVEARGEIYRDLATGPLSIRLRGGGRGGILTADATTVRRQLLGAGADATLSSGPAAVRVTTELWSAPEAVYPALAATGVLAWRRLLLHARVDRWLHDDLTDTGWSVGGDIRVSDRISVVVSAARPATDVLFSSPPQESWSVGVRYGLGTPRARALPVPIFAERGEVVRLEVVASSGSGPVRVAGSFSDWSPLDMTRRGDRWVVELRLEPGVHEYTFVDGTGRWFVPPETPGRKPDGYGGFVATVVVR